MSESTQPKVILHWLNFSRSHRILWLLELLEVNYEVKVYKRNAKFRAPKELEKVHPLGKSPVIEVVRPGKEPEIIAESGLIVEYLISNFDHAQKFTPDTDEGKRQVSYFLHYTEGTLQALLTSFFVLSMAKNQAPFGMGYLVGAVTSKINQIYFGSEALKNLKYLESIAKENDGGYFVDGKLTGADVILAFPIAESVFGGRKFLDGEPKELFPYLYKWSELVKKDPAFIKAGEVIESKSKL